MKTSAVSGRPRGPLHDPARAELPRQIPVGHREAFRLAVAEARLKQRQGGADLNLVLALNAELLDVRLVDQQAPLYVKVVPAPLNSK